MDVFNCLVAFFIKENNYRGNSKRCQAEESPNVNIPTNGLVPGKNEFKTQCSPYITNNRYPPCSCWCHKFASYLNVTQTDKWLKRCSRKFRTATQRFLLSTEKNSSSLTKIHITRYRPFRRCLFIINIGKCRCSPVDKDHGTYTLQGKVFTNRIGESLLDVNVYIFPN